MQMISTDSKRIIVGLGATGLSCARYFQRNNKAFSLMDTREALPQLEAIKKEFLDTPISLGELDVDELITANELYVSPGVSLNNPAIAKARESGVQIRGDIDLFCVEATAPIVAITGSNGKTTVTTLVGNMAKRAGKKVAVGGNIGTPVLDLIETEGDAELFVLELSSFQLERTHHLGAQVATMLNLCEDHMDHHKDMLSYHQAKHRIFLGAHQVVINRQDSLTQPLLAEGVKVHSYGMSMPDLDGFGLVDIKGEMTLVQGKETLMSISELKIYGSHNVKNALAALCIGHALGLDRDSMLQELREFSGLPHRCELVALIDGVRYFNDSKGTNVGATEAAIVGLMGGQASLPMSKKLVLIAGGIGKGANFSKLKNAVRRYCKAIVLLGENAAALEELFREDAECHHCDSMQQAVMQAKLLAEDGASVLLSPASASFDMFDNYEHRGNVFRAAVQNLLAGVDGHD